jgi:hypothetical protein
MSDLMERFADAITKAFVSKPKTDSDNVWHPHRNYQDWMTGRQSQRHEEQMHPDPLGFNDDPDDFKAGRSMMNDIDDRIDHEYESPAVGVTAQSSERKRFNTIPEE